MPSPSNDIRVLYGPLMIIESLEVISIPLGPIARAESLILTSSADIITYSQKSESDYLPR